MNKPPYVSLLAALVVAVTMLLSACATTDQTADTKAVEMKEPSLYSRLGGQVGVTTLVNDMYDGAAKDRRIRRFFTRVDMPALKAKTAEQICAATGGPCTYTGKDMKTAHAKLRINKAQFNAFVENLVKAMNKRGVPQKEQNELLAILGPMQGDIVTR